jgi:hypothetical protein
VASLGGSAARGPVEGRAINIVATHHPSFVLIHTAQRLLGHGPRNGRRDVAAIPSPAAIIIVLAETIADGPARRDPLSRRAPRPAVDWAGGGAQLENLRAELIRSAGLPPTDELRATQVRVSLVPERKNTLGHGLTRSST